MSRPPFAEMLPSNRQLVSIVSALIFAALAAGAVWGLTRSEATTAADSADRNSGAEFAPGAVNAAGGIVNADSQESSDQGAFDFESEVLSDGTVVDDDNDSLNVDMSDDDSDDDSDDNDSDSDDDDDSTTTTTESTTTTKLSTTTTEPTTTTELTTTTEQTTTTEPSTTTTEPSTTTTEPSTTTTFDVDQGDVVAIKGVLTESFTDCQSHLILKSSGEVVAGDSISCDGGSWIVVNGTRIQTSSGNVISGHYNKHKNIRPGTTVLVKASNDQFGRLSLACGQCSYSAIGQPSSTIVIEGKISEIVYQCIFRDRTTNGGKGNEAPELRPDPIVEPCLQGSSILVDGKRIVTAYSDGAGTRFDHHDPSWREGMKVRVTATKGTLTLNCKECGVKILG